MGQVFGYPGVYWSARFLLIVGMVGIGWLLMLLLARFFRPKHIVQMFRAAPPRVHEIGGEFRGVKATVKFAAYDDVLELLRTQVANLEQRVAKLEAAAYAAATVLKELSHERKRQGDLGA
jgi:hypothetical protein